MLRTITVICLITLLGLSGCGKKYTTEVPQTIMKDSGLAPNIFIIRQGEDKVIIVYRDKNGKLREIDERKLTSQEKSRIERLREKHK